METKRNLLIRGRFFALTALFFIATSMITSKALATNYYVSEKGNDAANGLNPSTPWKTIDKVNSVFSTMTQGDKILFRRGDQFYGTLKISKSGSTGAPFIIGAYGTGDRPVITGFITVTGWTDEGHGIYSKVITSEAQTNMVIIDGVQYGMGRWPDKKYNIFESHVNRESITDTGLGDVINWQGAEVVIRKNDWTLDRCLITKHTGDTLKYSNLGSPQAPYDKHGYFIQNDLKCLTEYGEWYHNIGTGKIYIFFGTVNPSTKTVKVATLNNLLNNNGYDYSTVEDLAFEGAIASTIYIKAKDVDNLVIRNCTINFSGADGIYLESNCKEIVVSNNFINHSSRTGMSLNGGNINVTDNTIKNSGLIGGIANSGTMCDGIFLSRVSGLIQYNNIDSSGYNGIFLAGNNIEVRNNFINNSVLLLDDGAGIYTGGSRNTGRLIDGNIFLNSVGNNDGTPNNSPLAEGIYLDENCANVVVLNNTAANCSSSGIKLHKSHENTIENNTSFNNNFGINFENWTKTSTVFKNVVIGNIFFSKEPEQCAARFRSAIDDIPNFGIADYNYYEKPINDNEVFDTSQPSTGLKKRGLADWKSFTNQDANSHTSTAGIKNSNTVRFEYNASKTNRIILLDQPMIDVKGTKYVKSITLLPFTSVVLLVDPNPA